MTKKDPSRELAIAASDLAADGKALDISILELRDISSVADYFVVASGRSHIQVESICDRIVEGIRERLGERPIAVEGLENSQWAVLDYGSVVIHVFQEGVRKLYDLERLWSLAPSWRHGEPPPAARAAAVAEGKPTPEKKAARTAAARNGSRTGGRTAGKAAGTAAGKPASKTPAKTEGKAAGKTAGKTAAKTGAKTGAKTATKSGGKSGAGVVAKSAAKKPAAKTAKEPAAKKTTVARSRATAASGSSEVAGTSGPSNVAGTKSPPRRIARA